MTDLIDLRPAADELTKVVANVRDSQLTAPTPCEEMNVAALLDHLVGLAATFRDCARKVVPEGGSTAPEPSAESLDPQWSTALPRLLGELAHAWRNPSAWEGMTEAGGVELPSAIMGTVALDEIVLHGWDLAVATGQPFECDPTTTQVILEFVTNAAKPEEAELRNNIFGPIVDVAPDARPFDRVLGLAGRHPDWTPAST